MKRTTLLLAWTLFATAAHAIVDMKNANYSDTWVDLLVPGSGYQLRVQRTYNSRALFNGMFGFGWCSDYETTLDITPEGNLKLTECGGGLEITFTPKNYDPKKVSTTIKNIMVEVRKRNKNMGEKFFTDLESDLKTDEFLREELAKQLNMKGNISQGQVFYANGRDTENVTLKGDSYIRALGDGTFQRFNMKGQLVSMQDKNGNFLKITRQNDLIKDISDNLGRKLSFTHYPDIRKVKCITGPNNLQACYEFKGDNLVKVVDAEKKSYVFSYDDLHNLIKVNFPDKTFKALTYNKDKDWVTSFTDRNGCTESYGYFLSDDDPKNHFWSTVEKKCAKEVVNKGRYEFWHKARKDGAGTYLHRVLTETNQESVDVTYHDVFGKPLSVRRNNTVIRYEYYNDGLVKRKSFGNRSMAYKYDTQCKKVSNVDTSFFDEKGKKVVKTTRTAFKYDGQRCNLVEARNSEGQFAKLTYDPRGRIASIVDQAKKVVNIEYEDRFGKPKFVSRPGLGSINVSYKPTGEIAKVESKEGPTVAVQVASIFNNLLDLISPATTDITL